MALEGFKKFDVDMILAIIRYINTKINKIKYLLIEKGMVKMIIQEIVEIIGQLNPLLEAKYKARVKGIFGSYVRGEETRESDLDVLVEFQKGANLLDLVGLSNYLEEKLHLSVDVVPVDTIRPEIKEQVFKEAVPV